MPLTRRTLSAWTEPPRIVLANLLSRLHTSLAGRGQSEGRGESLRHKCNIYQTFIIGPAD